MSDERVWFTLSRGISPELSDAIIQREVDAELADAEPALITGLLGALRRHLSHKHGRIPVEGEGGRDG